MTLRETRSHARKKLVLGLVLSVLAIGLQYLLQVRSFSDTEKICFSLIASAVIVLMGSFLKNLILTPPSMHREQQNEIARLEKQLADTAAALKVTIDRGTLERSSKSETGMSDSGELVERFQVCITLIVRFLNVRASATSAGECSLRIRTPVRTLSATPLSQASEMELLGLQLAKPEGIPEMELNVPLQKGIGATRYVQFVAGASSEDHLDTEGQLTLTVSDSFGGQSAATVQASGLTLAGFTRPPRLPI